MKTLLADRIVGKAEGAPAKDSTPTGKLSKKERMKLELKQELKADIGNVLQQMDSVREDTDPLSKRWKVVPIDLLLGFCGLPSTSLLKAEAYYQRMLEQGEEMILKMSRRPHGDANSVGTQL